MSVVMLAALFVCVRITLILVTVHVSGDPTFFWDELLKPYVILWIFDILVICVVGLYLLLVIAYVLLCYHSHLSHFDISPSSSMKIYNTCMCD